jgi:hypothetical protein
MGEGEAWASLAKGDDWELSPRYGAGHHPFKTFNGQLKIALGRPKVGGPAKTFWTIKNCPFKTSRPKS